MKKGFVIICQIFLLWVINELGTFIVNILHIPVPGNIIGMLLLLIFLLTGIIQLKWVDIGASLLNRHLSFFFIPISVGLMTLGSIFMSSGIRLLFILVLSAIIGIIGTGLTSQLLAKKREVSSNEQHYHSV
ncbi:CidA/LrgA family protein [Heyndrickxia oleronia]|uniref:Murein hydrolase regulator LrgA n=1 Tax=Heyndrickxia oleronia TaxID=38875 RepID=A0A8E2I631_9BACI|nr:CidA/LrgA family protein [Heyndrickxia oleronia]NYV64954.1 CidA/LrgA family protein [Bacillus sp. Gen3]MBU5210364.1 CidA/LrgA family protein [Heyndrickxia oleronia]MCM3453780.1 CidA/LrgA family protein [Heyndrickxia oleronia]MEC1374238.1 CidA/LrgA family protein [Heyndrickxia oleronia]OOP67002.1 murein hydrolase regulator LrgA [Heyndrickxia oleronia]